MRIAATLAIAGAPFSIALTVAATAHAQAPSDDSAQARAVQQAGTPSASANEAIFQRAEQLVRDGRGEAGRALVDSALARARPRSAQHAQALYWRASLAADAAEAERGYRHVILEYPATRWAGDALVNLAQLEMARGDQEQALVHLHRFEREYTSHESRGRASLWLARLYFERKNERRGCASLANARLAASPNDVELRNQIDYHGQRCIGVDTIASVPAPSTSGTTTGVKQSPPPTPAPTTPASTSAAEGMKHDVKPSAAISDGVRRVENAVDGFTVQVAAYDSRAAAEALIAKLKARGYTARLATDTRPFRVRIGRYDTRADAVTAQQRLKAKGVQGFVTEMEKQ